MTTFQKPEVGKHVTVTLRLRDFYMFAKEPFTEVTLNGIVGRSDAWHAPNTFVLNTDNAIVAKRVIALEHVVDLKYSDGAVAKTSEGTTVSKERVFKVKSSKGSEYLVILRGNKYTCDCIAGGFGRLCKHVKAVKEKVEQ